MRYHVSMKESDTPFDFTKSFSSDDAVTILAAIVGQCFDLQNGSGQLIDDGRVKLTLKSIGGQRFSSLNYAELCRQLRAHEVD